MAGFLDHLRAEIQALEQSLASDPRSLKLRELQRVQALYESPSMEAAVSDSRARLHKGQARREMSPATKLVVNAAREYLVGRNSPVPLRELYHEIAEVRGIPISGSQPINNLSAMLYRYGFEAFGRAGWLLRRAVRDAEGEEPAEEPNSPRHTLFSAPRMNGAASEIHGAATI